MSQARGKTLRHRILSSRNVEKFENSMYLFCHQKYDWVINKNTFRYKNIFILASWVNESQKISSRTKEII